MAHLTDITYYDGKISILFSLLLAGLKNITDENIELKIIIKFNSKMDILITGSKGFLGKSLIKIFKSQTNHNIYEFSKGDCIKDLEKLINKIDIVFHFAGINKAKGKMSLKKSM